jgi:hypothetical protein
MLALWFELLNGGCATGYLATEAAGAADDEWGHVLVGSRF